MDGVFSDDGVNREYLVGEGFEHVDGFAILYFGFGLVVAVPALVSLIATNK
jgi:hypothetical protein